MSERALVKEVLGLSAHRLPRGIRLPALALSALGLVGLAVGFLLGGAENGWAALTTVTVLVIGLALVGPVLSAIFQLTGAKWGRVYRRLAEGSVVLMPLGLLGVIVLMLGGNSYLPWVAEHPHVGGKAVWLVRGFWDVRVLLTLGLAYGVGLAFVHASVRRDFCQAEVRERLQGSLSRWFSKGISDPNAERARLDRRLAVLAPIVAIVYAVTSTMLAFDLIMALEPDWFSTLFGAWYFIGNLFFGLALLAILSVALRPGLKLGRFITRTRQADLATLLIAFCLINADFFWNQYLTIWYANLPEESFYLIERTVNTGLPWRSLSFVSLAAFFLIPFLALLLRKVKRSGLLLTLVAGVALIGVFLARFIEVAPPLLKLGAAGGGGALSLALASAVLLLLGFLGAGLLLYDRWLQAVPIMPVSDPIFVDLFDDHGGAA